MRLLELSAGDYALTIAPDVGGSLRSFTWRGEPLMRTAQGPGVLDAACFPMVPFCNRIAHGRFEWDGQPVRLSANFPGQDHPHPLHGFGWLAAWEVLCADERCAQLEHRYPGAEWPWPYLVRQEVRLSVDGLELDLSIRNLSDRTMPAGLGLHPYFPRSPETVLRVLHRGEWQNDADCIPTKMVQSDQPVDWLASVPRTHLPVDTVYHGRKGDIEVVWRDRQIELVISPSPIFAHTGIFMPADADWFCAEPMTHTTDALNRIPGAANLHSLEPDQILRGSLHAQARLVEIVR